jgi:hypothetical protein
MKGVWALPHFSKNAHLPFTIDAQLKSAAWAAASETDSQRSYSAT